MNSSKITEEIDAVEIARDAHVLDRDMRGDAAADPTRNVSKWSE
jgi:hypothetical protein